MSEVKPLTEEQIKEIEALSARVPDGPWFTAPDHADDVPDHRRSGLALVETGRSADWWIARLCEWPIAEFIAESKTSVDTLIATVRELQQEASRSEARIVELERRLRIPFGKLPCALCGGPHDFDTSVPSVVWNAVIRARALPDYLCTTCIVREFVRVGQGFTAELWNEEFNGNPIEVVVNGQNAETAG